MLMKAEELYRLACDMMKYSYSPYSHFRVGAALCATNSAGEEKIFTGCNVENASYGGCICAERTVAVKAVSEGFTHFHSIAVAGGESSPQDMVMPCGICRQFISEFACEDMTVILQKSGGLHIMSFIGLFPEPFCL